jgi:hypothetical protein
MDAVPGRIFNLYTYILHEGIFYGQCSEVCGVKHAYMPIVVQTLDIKVFLNFWYSNFFSDFLFFIEKKNILEVKNTEDFNVIFFNKKVSNFFFFYV